MCVYAHGELGNTAGGCWVKRSSRDASHGPAAITLSGCTPSLELLTGGPPPSSSLVLPSNSFQKDPLWVEVSLPRPRLPPKDRKTHTLRQDCPLLGFGGMGLQSSGNPKMLVCPSTFPSHHPSRGIPFLGLHIQRPGDLSASQPFLLLAGSCVQGSWLWRLVVCPLCADHRTVP